MKWFCAYNVAGQPVGLENVLCPDFETLTGLSVLGLMAGCLIEGTALGAAMLRAIDRVTRFVRDNTETMFRAGTAFFFIAIWAFGGILLTPELKTNSIAIAAIQLGIAAGMLSRTDHAAVGGRHRGDLRRRHLGIRHVPSRRLSGFPRRRRLSGADRIAARLFRRQGARYRALERRHHADVGVDREMGLSGMVVSAVHRPIPTCRWASSRISSCAPPAPSNSRWHSR